MPSRLSGIARGLPAKTHRARELLAAIARAENAPPACCANRSASWLATTSPRLRSRRRSPSRPPMAWCSKKSATSFAARATACTPWWSWPTAKNSWCPNRWASWKKCSLVAIFSVVHMSHLVNMNHIRQFVRADGGYLVMEDGATVSVARNRKEDFFGVVFQILGF
jgi:hypothetical protein